MNTIAHRARRWLVITAKSFPFILCAVVFFSYSECLYALVCNNYAQLNGVCILAKPISWFVGDIFTYGYDIVLAATILSIALETCVWNKLSVLYLYANLWERSYFINTELFIETIYVIVAFNVAVSGFLCYKGAQIYYIQFTKQKAYETRKTY